MHTQKYAYRVAGAVPIVKVIIIICDFVCDHLGLAHVINRHTATQILIHMMAAALVRLTSRRIYAHKRCRLAQTARGVVDSIIFIAHT